MQDEEIWLDEAEYEAAPVHRLRKAPIAAAIAAAAMLALVMAMPRSWIERAVYELYIDTLIPAARLPLGDMAHAVVAFVAAAIVALIAFAVARFVDFGRLLSRRDAVPAASDDAASREPRLRRADSHPDAPPRAPFRFGTDFDADDGDHENYAAESIDDPAAPVEDDADDALFDLGGFEAADDPIDGPDAPATFDVGALTMADETQAEEPRDAYPDDAEPLVSREVADDPMADVRAKFADMFGPGEEADDDPGEAARSDLSDLTTAQLIDELERRIATRNRGEAAEPVAPPATAEHDEAPVAGSQRQAERAANDRHSDEPVVEVHADDAEGGDDIDMDAALQAALGTLARMQQRSTG